MEDWISQFVGRIKSNKGYIQTQALRFLFHKKQAKEQDQAQVRLYLILFGFSRINNI
ncbi:MAG: hypothetical protein HRU40_05520 [Saprospiraceae bacterium]|nr:hypothetical protein [Saprospiraceae bacterium]